MKTSTAKLYWKVAACGSFIDVLIAVALLAVFYDTFAQGTGNFLAALRWGTLLGVVSAVFVVLATVALARKLDTAGGRISFVLLSFLAPIVGWVLVGVVTGLTTTWLFIWGYPIIGLVAGVVSGLFAVLATFFMPYASPAGDAVEAPGDVSDLFGT